MWWLLHGVWVLTQSAEGCCGTNATEELKTAHLGQLLLHLVCGPLAVRFIQPFNHAAHLR